jgi:hypothetical protein
MTDITDHHFKEDPPDFVWRVTEWSEYFAKKAGLRLPPMTANEIAVAITGLRSNDYPKPIDCPGEEGCPKFRPTCRVGICNVALGLCGDLSRRSAVCIDCEQGTLEFL